MKTTLNIDDELVADAKARAARERTTLTRLVEEGLAMRIRNDGKGRTARKAVRLPVYAGKGGLAPGIDPCSNESLFDAADA